MSQLTTLRLLKGVDLTKDYTNTFKHSTLSAQTSFFIAKSQHTFENLTYQRREGTIKVNKNVDTLYDINYLMFQNANYSNKWFYAFVVDMEWLSEDTTKVTYEIDVMQTWAFEMDIKQSFVERECVDNDSIGAHLIEENIDIGPVINRNYNSTGVIEPLTYVIATTVDENLDDVVGDEYTGVYSGLAYYASDDVTFLNGVIEALTTGAKTDALVAIFTMPKALVNVVGGGDRSVIPSSGQGSSNYITGGADKNLTDLDGYVPKNNKLFTYPYNYLMATNHNGQSSIYRYEFFSNPVACQFSLGGNVAPNPTVYMLPIDYKGVFSNTDEFLTLSDYPICSWVNDVYASWLAQNQVSNGVKIGGSAVSLVGGIATGNALAIGAGVLGVTNTLGEFREKSILPNQMKGSPSGGGNISAGIQTFGYYQKTITSEFAVLIDEYLSKYGYQVNRVKVPNITGRSYWNYVKLRDPNIFGDIPNKDLSKINANFERGITFWHGDNVGNYSLDNSL